ncbi:hypothetical protein BB560_000046 [Smittium megazygosporum]|uniref:Uncharacterized protein n=1 Tax=Smittium megazygosporum TaxID=133381 RepID=A0A2T9ZLJ1_9FUNG|nr:hypothetical protein BB560_000046 [Smittium megazygosporum]
MEDISYSFSRNMHGFKLFSLTRTDFEVRNVLLVSDQTHKQTEVDEWEQEETQ